MKLQGPILVGVDFSAASDQALRQGIDLANGLGTNLIVCHVVPELDTVNILFPQFADRNAEHRQTLIDKALAAVERQIATRLGDARIERQSRRRARERLTQGCSLRQTRPERVSSCWVQVEPQTEWYDTRLYRR